MGQENCGVTAAVSIFAFNSKWRYERKKKSARLLEGDIPFFCSFITLMPVRSLCRAFHSLANEVSHPFNLVELLRGRKFHLQSCSGHAYIIGNPMRCLEGSLVNVMNARTVCQQDGLIASVSDWNHNLVSSSPGACTTHVTCF